MIFYISFCGEYDYERKDAIDEWMGENTRIGYLPGDGDFEVWHTWIDDMTRLSAAFPDMNIRVKALCIRCSGVDVYRGYFKNGKEIVKEESLKFPKISKDEKEALNK